MSGSGINNGVLFGAGCIFILTAVVFLVKDYHKGGECALSSGFLVWVYCLLNVLLTPVSAFVTFLRHRKAAYVAMVLWSCELALVIFGAIVVYRPGPCAQFKATGLWTLAKMIFVLKIIYVGLMMFGTAIFCSQHVIKNCDKRSTRATSQLAQVEAQIDTADVPIADVTLNFDDIESFEQDGLLGINNPISVQIVQGSSAPTAEAIRVEAVRIR